MVCTANICRSPMAQGVFQKLLETEGIDNAVKVDSAGTAIIRKGHRADARAQKVALSHGVDLSRLRARLVHPKDFSQCDLILAMDERNFRVLTEACPDENLHKLSLIMTFAPDWDLSEVPDPYYANISGFERVFSMLEAAARGVMAHIRQAHHI